VSGIAARGLILLTLALVALTTLVIGIRRQTPLPDSLLTLNTCQLPCLYGVSPGVTDVFTQEQIARMTPWRGGTSSYRLFDPREQPAAATFLTDAQGDIVSSIFVYRLRADTNLGSLRDLLHLSEPVRVMYACNRASQSVYITFGVNESIGAEFRPYDGKIRPELPIISLILLNPYRERGGIAVYGCTDESPWRGFAPWWRYVSG
jgi:hypothetical protein